MIRVPTLAALFVTATLATPSAVLGQHVFESSNDIRRATDWIGNTVTTTQGQELGRVQDLAMDRDSGQLAYVVVSVGSFLIEHSLIAVHPDALTDGGDGRLVLNTTTTALQRAQRFASDQWPLAPDVLAAPAPADTAPPEPSSSTSEPAPVIEVRPPTGTATISSTRRTAVLSAGEKTINDLAPPPPAPAVASTPDRSSPVRRQRPEGAPVTGFDRLDKNGDGMLSRIEIATELTYRDSYTELDLDGNGFIDRAEFFPLED